MSYNTWESICLVYFNNSGMTQSMGSTLCLVDD